MKQYQINKAYNALGRLANMQLPVRDARNIYMLSKQLDNAYNFELEQEKKLIDKYHGVFTNDGGVTFASKEDGDNFGKALAELNNLDVDVDFDPVVISCEAMGDQRISPFDVACLDGFVVFK